MKLRIAFATDDGKTLISRHFGDAELYDIYEFNNGQFSFIKRILNTVDEEREVHANPRKARGISSLLLVEKVNVAVSKIFGPNIKRIRKKFVCIIIKKGTIESAIHRITDNMDAIEDEWKKGENRTHLMF